VARENERREAVTEQEPNEDLFDVLKKLIRDRYPFVLLGAAIPPVLLFVVLNWVLPK
jgi:hypothetical protein